MLTINRILPALFLFLSVFTSNALPASNTITICTDTNFWYPFTFVKKHKATGLHIDIITQALRNLGKEPKFKPMPWKECLLQAKEGHVDAVATVSYRDDRDLYLNYPAGAAVDRKSPWRVTEVEYLVITPVLDPQGKMNTYEFNGDLKTIPQPVRVTADYSVAEDLKKEGLKVTEGKDALDNFKKLAKERTGSVVDILEIAQYFYKQPEFADKLVIQKRPLNLKSYYLAFSKTGSVKQEEANLIWKEIARVRDNSNQMGEFLKKY